MPLDEEHPSRLHCDRCGYDITKAGMVCPECGMEVAATLARRELATLSRAGMPEAPYFRYNEAVYMLGGISLLAGLPAITFCLAHLKQAVNTGQFASLAIAVAMLLLTLPGCALVWWVRRRTALVGMSHEAQLRAARIIVGGSLLIYAALVGALVVLG